MKEVLVRVTQLLELTRFRQNNCARELTQRRLNYEQSKEKKLKLEEKLKMFLLDKKQQQNQLISDLAQPESLLSIKNILQYQAKLNDLDKKQKTQERQLENGVNAEKQMLVKVNQQRCIYNKACAKTEKMEQFYNDKVAAYQEDKEYKEEVEVEDSNATTWLHKQ